MLSKEQVVAAILESGISADLKPDMPTNEKLEDLGLDSLDIFNVFVELETVTGSMVPDNEIESLQSVDDIYKYFSSIEK